MIDKILESLGYKKVEKPTQTEQQQSATEPPKEKTAKEIATENNEPYIEIVGFELDPNNIGNGMVEFDWNDKFIANLLRAGYQGKTDADLVDRWFSDICRNVLAENFEQWEANQAPEDRLRVVTRNIGGGRSEIQ